MKTMKDLRIQTLWKVPVFCFVASWISFYATVYLGRFFFVVQEMGEDGVIQVSADPVRSAVFSAVLFLIVLLLGGLWAFRNMTKKEIAVSAAIMTAVYLLLDLVQILVPNYSTSLFFAYIQNWTATPASFLFSLTDNLAASAIVSSFSPLLFILFGKKPKEEDKASEEHNNT